MPNDGLDEKKRVADGVATPTFHHEVKIKFPQPPKVDSRLPRHAIKLKPMVRAKASGGNSSTVPTVSGQLTTIILAARG